MLNTGSTTPERMEVSFPSPNASESSEGSHVVTPSRRLPCRTMQKRMAASIGDQGKARAAGAAAGFSAAAGAMRGHLQSQTAAITDAAAAEKRNTLRQPARRMQSGEAR